MGFSIVKLGESEITDLKSQFQLVETSFPHMSEILIDENGGGQTKL